MWKLGKPVGKGGPWVNSAVEANEASDPYLFGYYDMRTLTLLHQSNEAVEIRAEIDPSGDNSWVAYKTFTVKPNQKMSFEFPKSVQGRWIRFVSNKKSSVTAWLDYK